MIASRRHVRSSTAVGGRQSDTPTSRASDPLGDDEVSGGDQGDRSAIAGRAGSSNALGSALYTPPPMANGSLNEALFGIGVFTGVAYIIVGIAGGIWPGHWDDTGASDQILWVVFGVGGGLILLDWSPIAFPLAWLRAQRAWVLGALLGALPIFWTLVPLILAVALIVLSVMYVLACGPGSPSQRLTLIGFAVVDDAPRPTSRLASSPGRKPTVLPPSGRHRFERAALWWLERVTSIEGAPRLQHFAEVAGELARRRETISGATRYRSSLWRGPRGGETGVSTPAA